MTVGRCFFLTYLFLKQRPHRMDCHTLHNHIQYYCMSVLKVKQSHFMPKTSFH